MTVWRQIETEDRRGNRTLSVDEDNPHEVRGAVIPQRSAKAEVPGQQQINVIRLIVDADLEDVGLWSRVQVLGEMWDVVTPPAYHHGTRRTRHWSIDVRQRPS